MENLNESEKKNISGCETKNEETQKSKMNLRTQKKIPNYFEKDLNLKLLNEKRTRTNFKSQKKAFPNDSHAGGNCPQLCRSAGKSYSNFKS